jgi:hypothetical protein
MTAREDFAESDVGFEEPGLEPDRFPESFDRRLVAA